MTTSHAFQYPAYPFDHAALDKKYTDIGESYEERRQRILREIQADYGPGCDGGANTQALVGLVVGVLAILFYLFVPGLYAFCASLVGAAGFAFFAQALPRVKFPQPHLVEIQSKNINDVYDRCTRLNRETKARLLASRKSHEESLRTEWRAFRAGEGGFDLYISEEGLTEVSLDKLLSRFELYVTYLYEYVWDPELAAVLEEHGRNPLAQGTTVNTTRLAVWERRRQCDQEQGLPVTIAEERERLDETRIGRARRVFEKTDLQTGDQELAAYLSSLEEDQAQAAG